MQFPPTSRISFSMARRTPGFAFALLRTREISAYHPETPWSLEVEAGKCALPQSLLFLWPRVSLSSPAKQTDSDETSWDCVYPAARAHRPGFLPRCFEFALV